MGEVSTRGKDGKDVRSAAQIEADIVRTRRQLAATLDELAVAVHPSTVIGSAKAQVRATVEQKTSKAFVAVNRSVEQVKAQFVDEKGSPRKERIVPVAAVGAALVVGVVLLRRRRR
ncbi:DUF3618 domain-containing protein [Streptacidiphilus sp. PB12-B1b]|uniref:DUF3618 domain-containing protein n=1 Tax=Streptacidiphilus sp. PB12-B1b TaxID=2705012 RepID=UPI001CDCB5F0|nr:DUF3618 domain-containing protein [Streptacidiphilus sp. PB12-B1b]